MNTDIRVEATVRDDIAHAVRMAQLGVADDFHTTSAPVNLADLEPRF